ncbi:hypothetical protein RND71_038958 [Anisodus tanguticus]|uniref:Pleiotropic regulator 1 n=1 Tax=Anisodus tanguticus TaxID=243964 RepID=A0AAE1R3N8_9SOLA|nr:hypothetical protein RND71_038958 [Anisodus tanguticus]
MDDYQAFHLTENRIIDTRSRTWITWGPLPEEYNLEQASSNVFFTYQTPSRKMKKIMERNISKEELEGSKGGRLKLTLTGHVEQIRGLAISNKNTYMFSAGDDEQVKCWDLEQNKVLTGSHDSTIKLWDIRYGKTITTVTHHKKSVRAMVQHPKEDYSFASASSDGKIKKFNLQKGKFSRNMLLEQKTIVNVMAVNDEGVMVTGGDDGSLWFWDWTSGHNFQQTQTMVQPGSLDSEAGIYAMAFDITGTILKSCEVEKM